eukprot:5322616-Pleurochrysis_carterae.AAC.1
MGEGEALAKASTPVSPLARVAGAADLHFAQDAQARVRARHQQRLHNLDQRPRRLRLKHCRHCETRHSRIE